MKYILTIILAMSASFSNAQITNWSAPNHERPNRIYMSFGYDYGLTTQVGYGKKIEAIKPILFSADFSAPQGKDRLDDFKVRIGGQSALYSFRNFTLSVNVYGNFRRHQTRYVRMLSFGSEISALFGYYKPKWHLAFEFGFDKSMANQLKHSDGLRDNFPEITDGWFIHSGGHFFYGVQGSRSIKGRLDLTYRLGGTNAQFNDENALLPYYAQVGFNFSFPQKVKTK